MSHLRRITRSILALSIVATLATSAPRATASPTLTYTVQDLGQAPPTPTTPGSYYGEPIYGSDAGGGLVFAADGSAYRFNPSSYVSADTSKIAPSDWSMSHQPHGYDNITSAYSNSNGLTVYFESSGIDGHARGGTNLNVLHPGSNDQQAWHTTIASVPAGLGGENKFEGTALTVKGVNDLDQVLFKTRSGDHATPGPSVYLYDSTSGETVDVGALLGRRYLGFDTLVNALDDQGRILLSAPRTDESETDLFLLTPTNLSADPVPVPEPSLLVFACVAIAAGTRRARKSNRQMPPATYA